MSENEYTLTESEMDELSRTKSRLFMIAGVFEDVGYSNTASTLERAAYSLANIEKEVAMRESEEDE